MKRMLVALMAMVAFSGMAPVHAADKITANAQEMFDNLPADKQAEMLSKMATIQKQAAVPETEVVETVDKWVDLGEKVGKMMGGAAKEIGVAVNDFVKTDVGRWTMALIVWNYIGADAVDVLVHVGGALLFWLVGFSVLFYLIRKSCRKTIKYDQTRKNLFGNYPILSVERSPLSGDDAAIFTLVACGMLIIGILMLLTTL